jgi:flagellar protein FlaG
MVQDTISNAILIIAVVIATTVVLNALYPAMFGMAGSIRSNVADADDRSMTSVTISYCSFDPGDHILRVWAKNSGRDSIADSELTGIRAYYGGESGSMTNYGTSYSLQAPEDGDDQWDPDETLEIDLASPDSPFPGDPGVHRVKLVMPNGATAEYTITT